MSEPIDLDAWEAAVRSTTGGASGRIFGVPDNLFLALIAVARAAQRVGDDVDEPDEYCKYCGQDAGMCSVGWERMQKLHAALAALRGEQEEEWPGAAGAANERAIAEDVERLRVRGGQDD